MSEQSFLSGKKDKEWFLNLWYYYKKWFFAAAFVLTIIIGTCVSCMRTINYDLEIGWFTSKHTDISVRNNLSDALFDIVEDADGKAGVNVFCHDYFYDADTNVKTQVEIADAAQIQLEFSKGEAYLYIMTPKWYESALMYNILDDVSEFTGDKEPVYAIEITDNALIKSIGYDGEEKLYAGIKKLSEKSAKKDYLKIKYNNAKRAIEYICQYK